MGVGRQPVWPQRAAPRRGGSRSCGVAPIRRSARQDSAARVSAAAHVVSVAVPHPVFVLVVGAAVVDHNVCHGPATEGVGRWRGWAGGQAGEGAYSAPQHAPPPRPAPDPGAQQSSVEAGQLLICSVLAVQVVQLRCGCSTRGAGGRTVRRPGGCTVRRLACPNRLPASCVAPPAARRAARYPPGPAGSPAATRSGWAAAATGA